MKVLLIRLSFLLVCLIIVGNSLEDTNQKNRNIGIIKPQESSILQSGCDDSIKNNFNNLKSSDAYIFERLIVRIK